jgi:preprotein translocase subunit SecE
MEHKRKEMIEMTVAVVLIFILGILILWGVIQLMTFCSASGCG